MYNKYHIRRALWAILLTSSLAIAGGPEYLGLTLNVNTQSDVEKLLKSRHSVFKSNYGYRGYSSDLHSIKIIRDPLLNKHGEIVDAWLNFGPDKKLYKISVTWRDAGETYTIVKDVFDSKYQLQKNTNRGFVKKHIYQNKDTEIILTRNNFGFGADQKTSVEYIYLPAVAEVDLMKAKIDAHIKSKNIKNKGINLQERYYV